MTQEQMINLAKACLFQAEHGCKNPDLVWNVASAMFKLQTGVSLTRFYSTLNF